MSNLAAMPSTSDGLLTGLFKDYKNAELAYQELLGRGYKKEDIHLLMSEETRKKHFPDTENIQTEKDGKTLQGAGVGGAIGTTVGAIAAALVAVGTSLAIPALGIVISGPLAASLAGAGVGGIAGGVVGALVGYGIPDEKAKLYEAGLKGGGVVIGVTPHSREEAATIEGKWRGSQGGDIFSSY